MATFKCNRCDSFGSADGDNPRCDCDETEDRLTAEIERLKAEVSMMTRGYRELRKLVDEVPSRALAWMAERQARQHERQLAYARPVVCVWCGNRYRFAGIDDPTQGIGCASGVLREGNSFVVVGHYGSTKHDTMVYRFVANPPAAIADPVCDACIDERLSTGDLIQIGEHL